MPQSKPCQAAGNIVADNIVCFPPAQAAAFVTCEGSCSGGATIGDKLAAFGSVARNNSFDADVCGQLKSDDTDEPWPRHRGQSRYVREWLVSDRIVLQYMMFIQRTQTRIEDADPAW